MLDFPELIDKAGEDGEKSGFPGEHTLFYNTLHGLHPKPQHQCDRSASRALAVTRTQDGKSSG
jgi:hypothetical protein